MLRFKARCFLFPVCLLLAVFTTNVSSQEAPKLPAFATVTIKPNPDGRVGNSGFTPDGYAATGTSLPRLIELAFNLKDPSQIAGLPGWAVDRQYDVAAKLDDTDVPAFTASLRQSYRATAAILQPVLTERFALKYHFEQRVLAIHELRLTRKTDQLRPWSPEDAKTEAVLGDAHCREGCMTMNVDGRVIVRGMPLSFLADHLGREIHGIVVDATGLTGKYNLDLQLPPPGSASDPNAPPGPGGDSLQDGLYQAGLALAPAKREFPVLVVDSIREPSPN